MTRGYKVRLFPTKEQEEGFYRHISACRYVWNYMIEYQKETFDQGMKHLSAYDMIRHLTVLKKDGEHDWLYEVSNSSLQTVCRDLDKAYKEFFKKTRGYPKFKSRKRAKPSYPVRYDSVYFDGRLVHIEKIGKVRYKTDFTLLFGRDAKFLNPRVSNKNGKWMLSFSMECENQVPTLKDKTMGIDLGIEKLATVAFDGEEIYYPNINKSHKMHLLGQKLRHTQRSISRKYEASKVRTRKYTKTKNIIREEMKLRRIHERISNIRNNYIHQATHKLVSMLPKTVIMEDLSVKNMVKNHHLARNIESECWGEFIRQMRYKCEWQGTEFKQADRMYPSSKTCSCCGNIKHDLKLSDRTYICPHCGLRINRDYNAALNLSRYIA